MPSAVISKQCDVICFILLQRSQLPYSPLCFSTLVQQCVGLGPSWHPRAPLPICGAKASASSREQILCWGCWSCAASSPGAHPCSLCPGAVQHWGNLRVLTKSKGVELSGCCEVLSLSLTILKLREFLKLTEFCVGLDQDGSCVCGYLAIK